MKHRTTDGIIGLLLAVAILIGLAYCMPVYAEPAYPVQDVPMDDMTDEMKDALIRSVITEDEEVKLAKMLYGEERQYGYIERAAVIWHVFNRVDSPDEANSVSKDLTHAHYSGYLKANPVCDWAVWVVRDVAWRYACEKEGYTDVGRVLPREYCYMAMHKGHNRFRDKYKGTKKYWETGLAPEKNTQKILKSRMNGGGKLKNRVLNRSETSWDYSPPKQDYFKELFRVSKKQIVWGGNYFDLPPTRGTLYKAHTTGQSVCAGEHKH